MKKLTILLFAFGTMTMCSCLSDKKLHGYAVRYYAEHPGELAHKCADEYPATVTPGDTIRTTDTTTLPGLVIPCPDRVTIVNGKVVHDSVKCPGVQYIHDKTFIHDTILDVARLAAMGADSAAQGAAFRAQTAKLVQTTDEKNKAKDQAKNRLFALIGCGVIFAGAVVLKIKNII